MSCETEGENNMKELSLKLVELKDLINESEESKQKEIDHLRNEIYKFKSNEERWSIWEKVKVMVFDPVKFISETAIFALQKAKFSSEAYSFGYLNYEIEIVEENGKFFEVQKFQKLYPSRFQYRRSFSITNFVDYNIRMSFIPELGKFFRDYLETADSKTLNSLVLVRNYTIWWYFKSMNQISNLSQKTTFDVSQKEQSHRKNRKPDKNAYPALFNWIIQMILNNEVDNQHNKAQRLVANRNQMLKKLTSKLIQDFEEEVWQLRNLKEEDFMEAARHLSNRRSFFFTLREKLEQAGIDQDSIKKYHKEYQSKEPSEPSFKKIYKLQDENQIYFWIIVMNAVLKELPLGSSRLENGSFMYWILGNPNLGLKLKMNLWSLEMRNHYYQQIKEAKNTLLIKFQEKNAPRKDLLQETLNMIEENPHEPVVDRQINAKRPAAQDLGEEELIYKVEVSNIQSLKHIPVSMPAGCAIKNFIEKSLSTFDGYLRDFVMAQQLKAIKYSLEGYQNQYLAIEPENN